MACRCSVIRIKSKVDGITVPKFLGIPEFSPAFRAFGPMPKLFLALIVAGLMLLIAVFVLAAFTL
jgi:hypothetical protein